MTVITDLTATSPTAFTPGVEDMVPYDIYKDIHKGVRAALFGAVLEAGSIDPLDVNARSSLATRVGDLAFLLDEHAKHENEFVVPVLDAELPHLADVIRTDHPVLDRRVAGLRELAMEVEDIGPGRARAGVHSLYLALASFTGAYLVHQDFEERTVMRALSDRLPVDALIAVDRAIVASIPPDEAAVALAAMLPAMNVHDRVEMLGALREDAPAEMFAGVIALAASVLEPSAWAATAEGLGLA